MIRPKLTLEELEPIIAPYRLGATVKLVGMRGYYKKTMGDPLRNDRGIYDDALFIIAPGLFAAFNANTDPSVKRSGVAVLRPGIYDYAPGLHGISRLDRKRKDHERIYQQLIETGQDVPGWTKTYWALRQLSNVSVLRDGSNKPVTDSPENRFWINIHRGSYNSTSSEGCQTIYPDQWGEFRRTVYEQLDRFNQPQIPYLLAEQ